MSQVDVFDEDNFSLDTEGLDDDFNSSSPNKASRSKRSQERRKWEPHEDAQLLRLIRKWGTKNWRTLANHMKGRLPKQCRERWINHLDPNITKGKLTDEEWRIVLNCHRDLGNRWSEIAKFLPGRTPNQIKNHWHAKVRKGSKRVRSDSGCVSEDSASSDSRDEMDETFPAGKKQRLVVFESPPDSPTRSPAAPFKNTLTPTGSWEDFETLVEMAEIFYKRENFKPNKDEPSMTASTVPPQTNETSSKAPVIPSLPSISYPPLAELNSDDRTAPRIPMKLALPEYDFGLRSIPRTMPLAPAFSYWRSL